MHTAWDGMLLSDRARRALLGYTPVSPRCQRGSGRRRLTLRWSSAMIRQRWRVRRILHTSPRGDRQNAQERCAGDNRKLECKIGQYSDAWKGVMGKFGHGDRKWIDRGERLLEFAKVNEMYICNTRKDGKPSRKWTWLSQCGRYRNMIDYVMIQRRWYSAARECRTFPGADIDSDHNLVLVLCNILLRLKRQKRHRQRAHGILQTYRSQKWERNTVD